MRIKSKKIMLLILMVVSLVSVFFVFDYYNLFPSKRYTAKDFNIKTLISEIDFNKNKVDDYQDFLLGAKLDAKIHPKYDGKYIDTGFPPDEIGVCTDVIWRAFKMAGYDLREMVNQDILDRKQDYQIKRVDKNIDFRRVKNLHVFFEKHAISLTLNKDEVEQWQPGDIVIFGKDTHIGIVSDLRNASGHPLIIHNAGQPNREEDYLKYHDVTKHYRFDAARIDPKYLIPFKEQKLK